MKKKYSILSVLLVIACMAMILGACGKKENVDDSTTAIYKVKVVDAIGNTYTSGVIAKFMKDGQQVAMQVCDADGVASKELDKDEYDIELAFTDGDEYYSYDKEGLKVTADKHEIEVVVAYTQSEEATSLYVSSKEYEAYLVQAGCTDVKLIDGRNYFLFKPTEAGTYEISIADGSVSALGYYGAPHYVQENSISEVKDNKFSASIRASMIGAEDTGTTVLVIGIDKGDDDSCVLGIERIGEPEYSVEDEPWDVYEKTVTLNTYQLPEGATLAEFDLTADSYELVFNETDGYYHLNSADGPLVLMRLTEDSKYLSCFKNILDKSGVVKYFYDEEGNFLRKEEYSTCLLEYIEYVDKETGTYPLTEDLKYILTQRGEYVGWWNSQSQSYLFVDDKGFNIPNINEDIAWLFMCCYIEE